MKRTKILVSFAMALMLAACGGGGGSGSASSPVATNPTPSPSPAPIEVKPPIAAKSTSYENAKSMGLAPITLPATETWAAAYARADFKGDGRMMLFAAHRTYDREKPIEQATPGVMGFYAQNASGDWVAQPQMIDSSTSCIESRKAVVADFNNDGKPDILLACTGYDNGKFPGERMLLISSTASGVFHVAPVGDYVGYFHGAAAADLDKDGLVDFVVTDNKPDSPLRMFKNKGNGVFDEVTNAFPALPNAGYFTVELLDIDNDGNLDVITGGHEYEGSPTLIIYGNGTPRFTTGNIKHLPATDATAGIVLDFVKVGDTLYVGRTNGGASGFYTKQGVQAVNLNTFTTTNLSVKDAPLFVWLLPTANGVVSDRTDRPL